MAGMETGTGDRGHVVKIILKSAYGVWNHWKSFVGELADNDSNMPNAFCVSDILHHDMLWLPT